MPPKDSDLTPMYRQWAQAKRDFPDVLILFRMGDFYEMFGDDAEIGAREMGLTLTARKYAGDKRMPMCGVPYHALDRYLRLLVEKGFRAAICEQTEDPKQAKGLVQRQVTRVVTPGTLTEDELLPATANNFLVSVYTEGQATGIAAVDVSTGDFLVTEVAHSDCMAQACAAPSPDQESQTTAGGVQALRTQTSAALQPDLPLDPQANPLAVAVADEINRLGPAEIIIRRLDPAMAALGRVTGATITEINDTDPIFLSSTEQLCKQFGVDSLRGFGCQDMPAAISAAAQALRYLQGTHLNALPRLSGLTTYSTTQFMVIDATTRRNLELTESLRGGKQGTLVGLLDKTRTPMGARLLRSWVVQPLLDKPAIDRRLDAVENLVHDTILSDTLATQLRSIYDLERLTSRVTAGTANGRDLKSLGLSLQRLPEVRQELSGAKAELLVELCGAMGDSLPEGPHAQPYRASGPGAATSASDGAGCSADTAGSACGPSGGEAGRMVSGASRELADVADLLARAIADDPPIQLTEGGLIRDGYAADLDELRNAAAHGREWIAALQDQERARTGIKNLKIGFNSVFGYYIEVSRSGQNLVPEDYTRKQTLANAERFITPELKEWESKVLGADERSRVMEHELFVQVRAEVAERAEAILTSARALAQVDVLCSLAQAATEYGYSKPEIIEGDELHIVAGRHPVVEQSAGSSLTPFPSPSGRGVAEGRGEGQEAFVPNDVHLDCQANQLMIITGPNMAGKSTYLRQVALITLLAQTGSFVPATQARIGLVDRIFTRVGASDDLATGQSTFMVEMTETANILHNASARSLIILDEIGRGTSTFDGLSIAWAVAEYIIKQIGAKTLFATHYHHLNELAEILPRVKNLRILVKEEGDHITFLRKIVEGGTDRSYGIQVARLAGLPAAVIERAKEVLRTIEQEDLAVAPTLQTAKKIAPTVQLQLFEAAPSPIIEKLKQVDVETLTPVEALLLLKELADEATG
ncbi:MAG: DNA mismatch repair protein MutS [Bacteroidota bacterium]